VLVVVMLSLLLRGMRTLLLLLAVVHASQPPIRWVQRSKTHARKIRAAVLILEATITEMIIND